MDIDALKQWIGRTQTVVDQVTLTPLKALSATLDRADPEPQSGQPIPPCWHWLYCLPLHPHSELGTDGHPLRGGFLPPVPLPQRMWAGSTIEFTRALCVGESIVKSSRIVDVTFKQGRAGSLVFVRVRHKIAGPTGLAVTEEQDIVYRESAGLEKSVRPSPPAPHIPAPHIYDWSREIQPDDVLLFRFSALTFNAHRIHYSHRYVSEMERYPGLVVHGPLIALLLLDLLRRHMPIAQVTHFSFRSVKPTYDVTPFQLCGRRGADGNTVYLWAQHLDGHLAMHATASLA